eukprot:10663465-Alexandrium_andersonii.AAC.1
MGWPALREPAGRWPGLPFRGSGGRSGCGGRGPPLRWPGAGVLRRQRVRRPLAVRACRCRPLA